MFRESESSFHEISEDLPADDPADLCEHPRLPSPFLPTDSPSSTKQSPVIPDKFDRNLHSSELDDELALFNPSDSDSPAPSTSFIRTSAGKIPSIAPETDSAGNVEYKLKLSHPNQARFERLVTQLKWRLLQGGGECLYEIGVMDDGALVGISAADMQASLKTLERMAAELGGTCLVLKEMEVMTEVSGRTYIQLISRRPSVYDPRALEGENTTTDTQTDTTDLEVTPPSLDNEDVDIVSQIGDIMTALSLETDILAKFPDSKQSALEAGVPLGSYNTDRFLARRQYIQAKDLRRAAALAEKCGLPSTGATPHKVIGGRKKTAKFNKRFLSKKLDDLTHELEDGPAERLYVTEVLVLRKGCADAINYDTIFASLKN